METILQTDQVCPICGNVIDRNGTSCECPDCRDTFHQDCWQGRGGCCHTDCNSYTEAPLPLYPSLDIPAVQPVAPKSRRSLLLVPGIAVVLVLAALIAHLSGVTNAAILLVAVVLAALGFDFVNGMNDSGNAIATVISTRVLTPMAALLMAAVLNFAGAVVMEGVAISIASKIVDTHQVPYTVVTPMMILCGLIGAIGWNFLMARIGLPISSSHALIGGLVGVLLLMRIPLNAPYLTKIVGWMVLAPILGFVVGWLLMVAIMWIFCRVSPHRMNKHFRIWQLVSSATMAFAHGANDAQKAMGIITLALAGSGVIQVAHGASPHIPLWVKVACATVIALGTGFGGKRVIGTLGHKIIKLTPVHGFAAEMVAASTILMATASGTPISTTHAISSSILGVGASKRLSAVRWGVAGNIVSAWIFTIPTCAAVAALLYKLVEMCGLVRLLG